MPSDYLRVVVFANGLIPLPDGVKLTNGGEECDMLVGPCSCGAGHSLSDDIDRARLLEAIAQQEPPMPSETPMIDTPLERELQMHNALGHALYCKHALLEAAVHDLAAEAFDLHTKISERMGRIAVIPEGWKKQEQDHE